MVDLSAFADPRLYWIVVAGLLVLVTLAVIYSALRD